MNIREYFKDVIAIEKIINNKKDRKKIIKEIAKSDYVKSLKRDLFIVDNEKIDIYEDVDEEIPYKCSNRIYNLKVNFRITLGLRDKKIKKCASKIPHKHDCYELIYVYDGTYLQYIGGRCIELKKGEACFLGSDVKHREEPLGENDTVFFICFSKNFFKEDIIKYLSSKDLIEQFIKCDKENLQEKYILFKKNNCDCNIILENIINEYFKKDIASTLITIGYIIRFLEILINSYKCTLIKENIFNTKNILFKEIEQYIDDNINNISREKIANDLHYNSNYINSIIKINTNLTYSEYVLNKKLDVSVKLLKNTDLSINKIIKCVGYTNKSYFYKIFISRYGFKPQEFRKILKNEI